MIFISNQTEEASSTFGLCLTQNNNALGLTLVLPDNEEVDLLCSTIPDLGTSMERSIERIGKATDTLAKGANGELSCVLSEEHPTEVAFYVKGQRIGLEAPEGKETGSLPVGIDVIPDDNEDEQKKRFPRDAVLFICPKGDEKAFLKIDRRNLVGKPIIYFADNYQLILVMVKYPIWSNLKYPVYMYILQGDAAYGATKLGYRTENKTTKNQLEVCDLDEAVDYLAESERIVAERAAQRDKENDGNQNRGGYHKNKGNSDVRRKGNPSGNTGFPSKYKDGNGGYDRRGGGKNYHKNGRR
jgi:hypothetical protein